MAFRYNDTNNVISFAEAQDVIDKDQRIFDANESLTEAVIETSLTRATERILAKMKCTQWWRRANPGVATEALPDIDADKILSRQDDFTDLCVYTALADYILPGVADFADPDSAERQKMSYYSLRADSLFSDLAVLTDWYDTDDSGTVDDDEKDISIYNQLKRVR